ncbi:hypothetical protein FSP39_014397 [Pinctada imbricata]|uniref:SOCS box domain-containing protein n=1 Tax=Pinctada imbricata TaxID=66713 RepID=A0AA89BMC7_PINIB|nr:hypothetical protein FSP39_014397 [Pinctada imbricata]
MDLATKCSNTESAVQALQYSIAMGYVDAVRNLLITHFQQTKLSDLAEQCSEILLGVVKSGSRDILLQLMPFIDKTFLTTKIYSNGKTYVTRLLCLAVEKGQEDVVKVLCENGADVNILIHGKPLLHFAITQGHPKIAELLLTFDADPLATDNRGETILVPVIVSDVPDKDKLIKLFVQRGVSPNSTGCAGKTPIHVAAAHSAEAVKYLVEIGCDVNSRDSVTLDTPLHVACARCCVETVEILISSGAQFHALNTAEETPLDKLLKFATDSHNFHSKSRIKLARSLIQLGFRINKSKTAKCRNGKATGSSRCKVTDTYHQVFRDGGIQVSSLQHLCRIAIRNTVCRKDVNTALSVLRLPAAICSYVAFDDLMLNL